MPVIASVLAACLPAVERSRALSGESCPIREPSGPVRAVALDALAPDFTLPRVGGGELTLSSLRGRRVVLVFLRGFG